MSTQALAEALVAMMEDDDFHKRVMNADAHVLADLRSRGLTDEEIKAVTTRIERWEADLLEVSNMGAWKLVTKDLVNVAPATKARLNQLLANLHTFSRSIPCTGS